MDWEQLAGILNDAIRKLMLRDGYLLVNGAHQQTYCAKLACHLERCLWKSVTPANGMSLWADYRVDVEYNRNDHTRTKKLRRVRLKNAPKKPGDSCVYPDMVIHKRGPDGPNLLVAEFVEKPDCHDTDAVKDFWKLAATVDYFEYQYGL